MNTFIINNDQNDYCLKSFNNLKKQDIGKILHNLIIKSKIKDSNIIAAEMVISGYTLILFDVIFTVWLKYINNNKKLLTYIIAAYQKVTFLKSEINNQSVRNIMSQIVSLLCITKKKEIKFDASNIKINKKYLLSTIKKSIDTNKLCYPLFLSFAKSDVKLSSIKEIIPVQKNKDMEKLYHYFINRKSINNAALVLYTANVRPGIGSNTIKLLDSRIIQVNMWINILYNDISNGKDLSRFLKIIEK
jgi:hypothetical protein